jgi:hypothetical protein
MPKQASRTLTLVSVLAAMTLVAPRNAKAEYAELNMAKKFEKTTLPLLGMPALVLDGISIYYLARWKGDEVGRTWVGGLQLLNATLLMAAGVLGSNQGSQAVDGSDSELRNLTMAHYCLAAVSVGLGIATLKSRAVPGQPPPAQPPRAMVTPFLGYGGSANVTGVALQGVF